MIIFRIFSSRSPGGRLDLSFQLLQKVDDLPGPFFLFINMHPSASSMLNLGVAELAKSFGG